MAMQGATGHICRCTDTKTCDPCRKRKQRSLLLQGVDRKNYLQTERERKRNERERTNAGGGDRLERQKAYGRKRYAAYKQSDEYKAKQFDFQQRRDLWRMKRELRELEKEAMLHLRRECKRCGFVFYMTKRHGPLMGCCSRACLQGWKIANGYRKPPPPVRNDPTESGVVYALVDPDTKKTRYIGKATNFKNRMSRYRCGDYSNPHQKNWLEKLKREGKWCEEVVLEECLFALGEAERKWIRLGREKGWPLTNQTEGGDSGRRSAEAKEKSRALMLALYQCPIERRKRRLASQSVAARKAGLTIEAYRMGRARRLRDERYRKAHANEIRQHDDAIRQATAMRRQAECDQRHAAERDARLRAFGVLTPLTHKGKAFVPLTRGAYAIIDAKDWDRVSQFKWSLREKWSGSILYCTAKRNGGGHSIMLLSRFILNATPEESVRFKSGNHLNCRKCNIYKDLGSRKVFEAGLLRREQPPIA